jgi:hypothetical protein
LEYPFSGLRPGQHQAAGIEIADSIDAAFTAKLAAGLGLHRAWDRAATVMASSAPPAG